MCVCASVVLILLLRNGIKSLMRDRRLRACDTATQCSMFVWDKWDSVALSVVNLSLCSLLDGNRLVVLSFLGSTKLLNFHTRFAMLLESMPPAFSVQTRFLNFFSHFGASLGLWATAEGAGGTEAGWQSATKKATWVRTGTYWSRSVCPLQVCKKCACAVPPHAHRLS